MLELVHCVLKKLFLFFAFFFWRKAIPGNIKWNNKFRNHVVLSLNTSLTFRWGHFSRSVWWSGCNVCLGGLVCARLKEMDEGEWHSFLIKWGHWVWKRPLTHVFLISSVFFSSPSFLFQRLSGLNSSSVSFYGYFVLTQTMPSCVWWLCSSIMVCVDDCVHWHCSVL